MTDTVRVTLGRVKGGAFRVLCSILCGGNKYTVCFLLDLAATARPGGVGLQSQLLRRLRKGDLKFKACLRAQGYRLFRASSVNLANPYL